MDIFDVLTLVGGLCLFLFGMNVMGQSLERSAGSRLQSMLGKLTTKKMAGLFTGLGVTAVIQSSSATTVMVVGFVNSGLMTLRQAINVIMGANIGTTITSWIISLGGISGDSIFLQLLKPMSFTPILALIGIVLYMFCKSNKKKDIGTILLSFAVLMFGMDIMTGAVSGLKDIPAFQQIFVMFKNPLLGVLVGAVLTAIIQSSSASVGILQALAMTGAVSYGAAIPIIMGQNIGTCITAILASFGTNRNAKRAAIVHLSFNVIGTLVWMVVYVVVDAIFSPVLFDQSATMSSIAVIHSIFNVACILLLLPATGLLEKLAYKIVPEAKKPEEVVKLDERLFVTPAVALERCNSLACEMAQTSVMALKLSIDYLVSHDEMLAEEIKELESKTDHYEDVMSTYLVKLSARQISDRDGILAAKLLKVIGDFERIADHALNVLDSANEIRDKGIQFTEKAKKEITVLTLAVKEILDITLASFEEDDVVMANRVEPLEEIIDVLKEKLRSNHIARLQRGDCTIEAGFVWSDLLTALERVSDHCSNIAGCVRESKENNLNLHESVRTLKLDNDDYKKEYERYAEKYLSSL